MDAAGTASMAAWAGTAVLAGKTELGRSQAAVAAMVGKAAMAVVVVVDTVDTRLRLHIPPIWGPTSNLTLWSAWELLGMAEEPAF
ncbi:hypothetical protein BE21_09565 [Sorangium cellulosum]|uniref:Uncharacterized protein n=2 Tax=Sorangium cellulosum TaxID=56 RepID=A0A150U2E2_SORCE|nr:hypothetical protein SCE1572_37650 [Sorangium cellulosum So0157-2]KYG10928.1 hypothetical protein BE21_09565 [Sorangium cellulosum]